MALDNNDIKEVTAGFYKDICEHADVASSSLADQIKQLVKDDINKTALLGAVAKAFQDVKAGAAKSMNIEAQKIDLSNPLADTERKVEQGTDDTSQEADTAKGTPTDPILKLTVHEGRDLLPADMGGTSDPYVVVKAINRDKEMWSGKSNVVNKSLSPSWNFDADIPHELVEKGRVTKLVLQVMDKDSMGSDDFLGEIVLELGGNVPDGAGLTNAWVALHESDAFPRSKAGGEIKLTVQYISPRLAKRRTDGFE